MDKITLRKVQLVQLEIAKEIARICEENNINYILSDGTLIGAIRHGGFIPWDDDLDIAMLRKDYDKFMNIVKEKLGPKFELVDWRNDKTYPHPMAKIVKKGTIYREKKNIGQENQGIWVDVFPFDNLESNDKTNNFYFLKLKILRGMIRSKCKYKTWLSDKGFDIGKYIKNLPLRLLSVAFTRSYLIEEYEKLSIKYNEIDTEYIFHNSIADYKDYVFPKRLLNELIKVKFENYYFCIPKKYDELLTLEYGEYMKLPPENERGNQHMIVEVDFGDEK